MMAAAQNQDLELFQDVQGTLVPAFGKKEASEHSTFTVPQMTVLVSSTNFSPAKDDSLYGGWQPNTKNQADGGAETNLSGESESPKSEAFSKDRRSTNLPVPVLADADAKELRNAEMRRAGSVGEAREGTKKSVRKLPCVAPALDSRGGQNSFDGATFSPRLDESRLKAQLVRVRELMRDGLPRTLAQIAEATGDPESSVSARLRDLRKPKHGLWTVSRKRLPGGLHTYWLGGKGL